MKMAKRPRSQTVSGGVVPPVPQIKEPDFWPAWHETAVETPCTIFDLAGEQLRPWRSREYLRVSMEHLAADREQRKGSFGSVSNRTATSSGRCSTQTHEEEEEVEDDLLDAEAIFAVYGETATDSAGETEKHSAEGTGGESEEREEQGHGKRGDRRRSSSNVPVLPPRTYDWKKLKVENGHESRSQGASPGPRRRSSVTLRRMGSQLSHLGRAVTGRRQSADMSLKPPAPSSSLKLPSPTSTSKGGNDPGKPAKCKQKAVYAAVSKHRRRLSMAPRPEDLVLESATSQGDSEDDNGSGNGSSIDNNTEGSTTYDNANVSTDGTGEPIYEQCCLVETDDDGYTIVRT